MLLTHLQRLVARQSMPKPLKRTVVWSLNDCEWAVSTQTVILEIECALVLLLEHVGLDVWRRFGTLLTHLQRLVARQSMPKPLKRTVVWSLNDCEWAVSTQTIILEIECALVLLLEHVGRCMTAFWNVTDTLATISRSTECAKRLKAFFVRVK